MNSSITGGWNTHNGMAVALPLNNIDTDQIIPARFMSQPRVDGYETFLFHDLRLNDEGKPDRQFVLNRHSNASVLLGGVNFGSGSSREAAVYALVDSGIQAVVAASFADIFAANAINNGLLPVTLSENNMSSLFSVVGDEALPVSIDISAGTISIKQQQFQFSLDENTKQKLLNGWDDIDLTLHHSAVIDKFSEKRYDQHSWALPRIGDNNVN